MKTINYFCLLIFVLSGFLSHAQFERKLNTHAYLAVPFLQKSNNVRSESIFENYGSTPYLGFGLNYAFNTKLSAQIDLRFLYTSKLENVYSISHTSLDWQLKYNIVHNDKPFSPYGIFGFNTGTLYLVQKENSEENNTFEQKDGENVKLIRVEKRNPEIKFTMFPSIGILVGVGLDMTFKKRIGINIGALYQTSNIHQHVLLDEFFPENSSTFNFVMIQAGIKFSFLQAKKI